MTLIVIGLLIGVLAALFPMDATIRKVAIAVAVVFMLVGLLIVMGLWRPFAY